ncbi:hypothetical protein MHIP_01860 [Mycolicibacterium hippocampi]|uniref:Uncharacterized protein n=1 Tax=Mycolicibacterium hippocampi TaxID=659824 RepID=A0A7I9ZFV5_9MYCO|nr:hypothetical protein MHIP_01860 [Mycolicibacterium hippocampi]
MLYLAARDLEPAGFSVFGVFWGAFGLVSGAAFGLLQETTREIRSAAADPPAARTHPLRVGAGVGVTAALLIAATSPLWSQHVFVEDRALSVALLCGGLAGFCLHTTLLGALAGVNRWSQYGALMVTDAVLRVAVAVATFAVGWGSAAICGRRSPARSRGCCCLSPRRRPGRPPGSLRSTPPLSCAAPGTRSPRPVPARSW